jgi:hypothetical protein
VAAAVIVHVDGDPRTAAATAVHAGTRTAASAWWQASGYLPNRVLDDGTVLGLLEGTATARQRLDAVRTAAGLIGATWMSGTPAAISSRIEQLTATGPDGSRPC